MISAEIEEEVLRRVVEWQEALERRGHKVNAKKTEDMVCTREVTVEEGLIRRKNID